MNRIVGFPVGSTSISKVSFLESITLVSYLDIILSFKFSMYLLAWLCLFPNPLVFLCKNNHPLSEENAPIGGSSRELVFGHLEDSMFCLFKIISYFISRVSRWNKGGATDNSGNCGVALLWRCPSTLGFHSMPLPEESHQAPVRT